jgi:hypothetical protein
MKGRLFLKRKAVRITGLVVGISIVFFVAFRIFVAQYLPGMIRKRIIYLVENGSDGLYKCTVGDVYVGVAGGTVQIKNLEINVDSARFKQLELRNKLPDITFRVKLNEGKVTGFQVMPFLFHKKIRLHTLKAEYPDIIIHSQYNAEKERLKKKIREIKKNQVENPEPVEPISEQELWQLIKPEISGIYAKWVFLDHMKFSYRKAGVTNEMKIEYQDLSASLKEIRIDSVGAASPDRILFTEDLSMSFIGLKYYSEDSLYVMYMDSMLYSSYAKNIFIRGFGVGPTLKPIEFMKRVGHQVDVFDVKIPEINVYNFQIDKIFTENAVTVDTVHVQKSVLKIYHDRTFSPDTVVKYGQYPNEALLLMPITLRVPVVVLFDSEVHYIEKQAVTFQTGDGFFTHVSGTITNVTNDSLWLKKNSHMKVDMVGNFLHSGKMTAGFDFDLGSNDGHFTARADLGSMGPEELSIMTVPFGNLKMKSADLKEAHFRLTGNRNGTVGSLRMIYEDLCIELLKKGNGSPGMKKDKLMTFLANLVGIRKGNPANNGKETIAHHISVERTPPMPFFNMIWRTLFGGMKDIMLKGPAKKIKIGQEE